MVSADRQLILETNRSLRNIKTELENLLEKGVIDEAVFDQIHSALPQESPLSGPLRRANPVLAHVRALYRYVASDNRDVSFDKDDKIVVYEYMNQDWWMGQNTRTQQEGIFPRNYVLVEHKEEKSAPYAGPYSQPQYGYPPPGQGPPPQQNPYNSNVPPMAVAQGGQGAAEGQQGDGNKVNEYGKKFGKKLGNAAIFGAGATLGGNLVNSIF
ncbi:hypothetical protein UVI_02005750 [Ustilaginoidea virens]|uniref:SH3 domain-containing protein n=1 Tax=Ustilaginoidea virens TaxID=1159556 RepID=A0A1B5KV96_USTVR|nr:hypothetical protein UVI_02005750 [Ustilaginoidea virens]